MLIFKRSNAKTVNIWVSHIKCETLLNPYLLWSIGFTVSTNQGNREFSHFGIFQKCTCGDILQTTRARNEYVTPMSFSWHRQSPPAVIWWAWDRWGASSTTVRRLKEKQGHGRDWTSTAVLASSPILISLDSGRRVSGLYIVLDVRFLSQLIWNSFLSVTGS